MSEGMKKSDTGLLFTSLSINFGALFYFIFALIFKFKASFVKISFLEIFLIGHLILTVITYFLSLRKDFKNISESTLSRTKTVILILVCVQLLSAMFPALSIIGMYPVPMGFFQSLFLFFTGISFGAIVMASLIVIWRSGCYISVFNFILILFAIIILFISSYLALSIFEKLLP